MCAKFKTFFMKTASEKLDALIFLMDNLEVRVWVEVKKISRNEDDFIQAIKDLIDFENKPYEFSNDYTKVRRYQNEHTTIKRNRAI